MSFGKKRHLAAFVSSLVVSVPLVACGGDDSAPFTAGPSAASSGQAANGGAAFSGGSGGASATAGSTSSAGTANGGAFSSPLDDNRTIESLSSAEWQQLCRAQLIYFISSPAGQDLLCLTAAMIGTSIVTLLTPNITDAEVQSECAESLAECRTCTQNPGTCPDEEDGSGGAGGADDGQETFMCDELPGCQATVAEFEACVTALPAAFEDELSSAQRCASLSVADLRSGGSDDNDVQPNRLPPECQIVEAKCPGFGSD